MRSVPIATATMDMGGIVVMAAVLVFVIVVFPRLQRRAGRQREGWKYLTVSIAEWLICALAFGLTCTFIWGYAVIGSARSDAASQMLACKLLILMFAPLTAFIWWHTFSSFTRWNDDCIEQDVILAGIRKIPFKNISSVRTVSGTMYIDGNNGQRIRVSLMHNGAREFAEFLLAKFENVAAWTNQQ